MRAIVYKWEFCGGKWKIGDGTGGLGASSRHSSWAFSSLFLTLGLISALSGVFQMYAHGVEACFQFLVAPWVLQVLSFWPTPSLLCLGSCWASLPCTLSSENGGRVALEGDFKDVSELPWMPLLFSFSCLFALGYFLHRCSTSLSTFTTQDSLHYAAILNN